MRKLISAAVATVLAVSLAACGSSSASSSKDTADKPLRVGAVPVPHADILNYIKTNLAPKAGLKLDVVEFNDYVQPNLQLQSGLDANYYQHKPYMDDFAKTKGLKLTFVKAVHLEPLGLYSKKVRQLAQLPQGGTIAVPNDATNLGRALKLLADNGVITLKPGAGVTATERDVAGNPKGLKFKPLEAPQLPRSLDDVSASIINGNYALEKGLKPTDALVLEKAAGNPYTNGLVTLTDKANDPRVQKLATLLTSPEVKKFITDKYKGAVLPAF